MSLVPCTALEMSLKNVVGLDCIQAHLIIKLFVSIKTLQKIAKEVGVFV